MPLVRVPTPLRPYTDGQKDVEVAGETVAGALASLAERYPPIRPHLFDESGALRSFVHVFLDDRDVRDLNGDGTRLESSDRLLIVPSIAGGFAPTRPVDHQALRMNQAMIIALLGGAYVANGPWLAAVVGLVMLLGSLLGRPGFLPVYQLLRAVRLARPDVYQDHPEPHRFAQLLGGLVLAGATSAFVTAHFSLGWVLTWVVIALAGVNLFGGFCAGCAVYYWLARWRIPGFTQSPPQGVFPGRRPTEHA
jgi:molybdopterin converting factor small subunit